MPLTACQPVRIVVPRQREDRTQPDAHPPTTHLTVSLFRRLPPGENFSADGLWGRVGRLVYRLLRVGNVFHRSQDAILTRRRGQKAPEAAKQRCVMRRDINYKYKVLLTSRVRRPIHGSRRRALVRATTAVKNNKTLSIRESRLETKLYVFQRGGFRIFHATDAEGSLLRYDSQHLLNR